MMPQACSFSVQRLTPYLVYSAVAQRQVACLFDIAVTAYTPRCDISNALLPPRVAADVRLLVRRYARPMPSTPVLPAPLPPSLCWLQ